MKIKIPLTGRVLSYDPELAKYGGSSGIAGDLNDPVRPIPVNLGHVSWKLVGIDLENDLAEIEISPSEIISVLKDGGNPDKPEDWISRLTTEEEKLGFLDYVSNLLNRSTDELYAMSGKARLSKSEEVMVKYRDAQSSMH